MARPKLSTVSRLYCVSHNRCAYPGCDFPLLEPDSKVLVAEVCHIEADSPDGPRFNKAQTEAERQSFSNLMILCSNHHKVIDTDLTTWTVERLGALKNEHEATCGRLPDPEDEVVLALQSTVGGSVIATINQSGGQVAHQIINQGTAARLSVDAELFKNLIDLLPSTGTIAFLRHHDFWTPFKSSTLHPLMDFVQNWDNAQHRFVDGELEALRAELHRWAADFCRTMATNTSPDSAGFQAVRTEYGYSPERESRYRREAAELNDRADAVVQKHEALVKRARERLEL